MILLALHPPYADPSTTIVLVGVRGEVCGVVLDEDEEEDGEDVVAIVLNRPNVELLWLKGIDRRAEQCTLCVMGTDMHKVGKAVMDVDNADRPSMYTYVSVEQENGRRGCEPF